jgi:hypothetical protein
VKTRLVTSGVDASGKIIKGGPKDPSIKPQSASDKKTAADLAFFEKHGYYPPTGPPKDGATAKNPGNIKLAPPATQSGQVAKINGAYANIKTLMSHPQAVKGEVETLLRAGKVDGVKYTQDQIDVAFDRFRNKGGVSNRGAHKLHTMGVSVSGHYRPAKAQRPRGGGITGSLVSRIPS